MPEIVKIIKDIPYNQSPNLLIDLTAAPLTDIKLRISAYGEISAQGKDHRLLIRLNGETSKYKSYYNWGGDGGGDGEWDTTGFYLGRNGNRLDSTFSLDYTLTINSKSQKVLGSGMSIFVNGDGKIYGCESHGYLETSTSSLKRIELLFLDGGAVSWASKIYTI